MFDDRSIPREVIREIVQLGQWAPYSCNLQLAQCTIVDDPELLEALSLHADAKFGWAPCILVLSFDGRLGRKRSASEISIGGMMQTILLAATEKGISTCPMAGFAGDQEIKKRLNIPREHELALLIAMGYPTSDSIKKEDRFRLSFGRFAFWNRDASRKADLPKNLSMRIKDWSMNEVISYRERLAPVYLYDRHYRLQVFSDAVFESAVSRFFSVLALSGGKILDLCTYDGAALRCMLRKFPDAAYTFSDHLPYVGSIFRKFRSDLEFVLADESHVLEAGDASVDAVTCFHKIEFTPNWERIVREAFRVLKPGGYLFISTSQPSFAKRFFDMSRAYFLSWPNKPNVYDGNPYYKIGPFGRRNLSSVSEVGKQAGFCIRSSGVERVHGAVLGHDYGWILFSKDGSLALDCKT